jgi:hypothetical protein
VIGRITTAVAGIVIALALTGCATINDRLNEARDYGLVEGEGELTNVSDLVQGDCINDSQASDDGVSFVPVVDCDVAHDSEIYLAVDMNSDDGFPGDEVMAERADKKCVDAFETFIGVPYGESEIEMTYLYPTRMIWIDGSRDVLCMVYSVDADYERTTTVGTLEGSGL